MTTNLSGTPTDGQELQISITGTATRAIAWGASFEDGGIPLPTTTSGTARLDVFLVWNAATSKWRCTATSSDLVYLKLSSMSAANATDLTDGGETTLHYHIMPSVPGGRLTLTSGTPVTVTDVSSSTNVYYTPYIHNVIMLWDGTIWKSITFSEVTLALGAVTSGLPYDVFAYLSGGALAIEKLAWTNTTTRATGISLQDGRYCKTGDKTRLYLGSFYTTSTTQTADTTTKRFLFNVYNRKFRKLNVTDTTDSWIYSTAVWRSWNNSTSNRVEVLVGINDDLTELTFNGVASNTANLSMGYGIGVDSTSTNSADTYTASGSLSVLVSGSAVYKNYLPVGYHYLQALEYGSTSGTTRFFGDASVDHIQSGMIGWCMA